jgi:uncharacterized surface protein with fasciclin (FAS1) repeats
MMTKYINKLICGCLVGCGLAAATACSDWDDHYGDSSTSASGSNLSLWEELKANNQLSDFCEVLEQTKVFRMHKKTSVSYADLLKGGQSFTVIAPVNGSFDKDAYLKQVETAQGDSAVEHFFIKNHLLRSVVSVNSDKKRALMLNQKYAEFTNSTVNGISIQQSNIHAKNGVIHSIAQPLTYRYSIYEILRDRPEFSLVGRELLRYNIEEFDPDLSVSSGIVDGVPIYVDSVTYEYNKILYTIGEIDSQDSLFWMVAPTNAGWEKAWNEVTQYFVYDSKNVAKADSVQNYWTLRAMLDDAIFNMTDNLSPSDSLVSVPYVSAAKTQSAYRPVYHKFLTPFMPGGILYNTTAIECCNGILYQSNEWPLDIEKAFFHPIWTETMDDDNLLTAKNCVFNSETIVADSVSEGNYLYVKATKSTENWELNFRVKETLSGAYDVCAVILPESIDPEREPGKPIRFVASINYFNEKGDSLTFDCNEGAVFITEHPERIDTVVLAENFKFPASNYFGPWDYNNRVSVSLKRKVTKANASKYSQEINLDCIYLRPKKQ